MSARGNTIYLIPQQVVKIEIPVNEIAGEGFFARISNDDGTTPAVIPIENELKTLQNGFCVGNEKAGEIIKVYSDAVAIDYKHKLGLENVIYFFAATGEWGFVEVSSVPVHDHSTLVQGGPAYGTYFTRVDGEEA
jgi:hypothetical protein